MGKWFMIVPSILAIVFLQLFISRGKDIDRLESDLSLSKNLNDSLIDQYNTVRLDLETSYVLEKNIIKDLKTNENTIFDLSDSLNSGGSRLFFGKKPTGVITGEDKNSSVPLVNGTSCETGAPVRSDYLRLLKGIKDNESKIEGLQTYIKTFCN